MTDQTFVAPDTDDLDAFNSLMYGSAKPLEESTQVEEAEMDDVPENVSNEPEDILENEIEAKEVEELLEPEPEVEPERPVKKTAKERINELTAARKEAERLVEIEKAEKAILNQRLADLEAKLNAPIVEPKVSLPVNTEGPSPSASNEDGTPKYPLAEFDPAYIADLTRYTIGKVSAEQEAQEKQITAQKAAQEYNQTLQNNWNTKLEEAKKTTPDIVVKTQALESTLTGLDPNYGQFLAQTIMGMDKGPEVLYHLASHIDEAKEIVSKGPLGAAIALGRLEARFEKSETKTPPRVSSAPKPAPQAARGVAVGGQVPADTDDLDAFSAAFFATRKRR